MRISPRLRPARIVVIRPRGLGDVVLSSAVIDALHRAYPDASIDYLSEKPSRAFLEHDVRLDRIFLLGQPRRPGRRVRTGGMRDAIAWMRDPRPDIVLDLFSNPRTALLTASSRGRFRIGLDRSVRRFAYNLRVPRFHGPPEEDYRYAQEVQLDFLRGAGVRWPGEARARVAVTEEDVAFARRSLAELDYAPGSRFGAVLPGGSWESKRWTVEGFAAVGEELARRFGKPTLVAWGPPERRDAEQIAELLGEKGRLAPPMSLREMTVMLAQPALLVATDCLGRHLAIVQGIPTVGVFGSTDPRSWTPPTGPHRAVRGGPEEGYETLRELPAAPVIDEVARLWSDGTLDLLSTRT